MQTPALCPLWAGGGLTGEVTVTSALDAQIEINLDFRLRGRCQGAGSLRLIRWSHADKAPSFFQITQLKDIHFDAPNQELFVCAVTKRQCHRSVA